MLIPILIKSPVTILHTLMHETVTCAPEPISKILVQSQERHFLAELEIKGFELMSVIHVVDVGELRRKE
jgi:hypothetical protein